MSETALITGAAHRIGAAMARCLAEAGYRIVVHYNTSRAPAESLVAEIERSGGEAVALGCDLTERAERRDLITRAALPFGALSVLVNNASLYEPDSVETLDEALWDRHFALHAEAPLFLARDFARQLPEEMTGNIVNIIDERVWSLAPAYTSYTLSKSVLWTATRTMAQTLAPRIRVNAIGPGPTLPHASQTEAQFDESVAQLPLRRGPTPDDIAGGLLYLLGAPTMTGQMLALDGGEHLAWRDERGPTPKSP